MIGVMSMTADEVYEILEKRQSQHENKCDERQKMINDKIDNLAKYMYIGFGGLIIIEVILLVFGPTIAQAVFASN